MQLRIGSVLKLTEEIRIRTYFCFSLVTENVEIFTCFYVRLIKVLSPSC